MDVSRFTIHPEQTTALTGASHQPPERLWAYGINIFARHNRKVNLDVAGLTPNIEIS
jgi:hypothetical protein